MTPSDIDTILHDRSPGLIAFAKEKVRRARRFGMEIVIKHQKAVMGNGMSCGGWCGDEEARVAYDGSDRSICTLIHELCHTEQRVSAPKTWGMTRFADGKDAGDVVDDWLKHRRNYGKQRLLDCFRRVITLERDCESRALRNIRKYGITDIMLDTYTAEANRYLLAHAVVMFKQRSWRKVSAFCEGDTEVPTDRLYLTKEILRRMA